MRRYRGWEPSVLAGAYFAVIMVAAAIGGCGMQIPSVRGAFYLKNDDSGATAHRSYPAAAPAYSAVEYYCSGPNFDPNAECLPPGGVPNGPAYSAMPAGIVYVRQGDTLYSIARQNGCTVGELAAVNRLRTAEIQVGQRLVVPGSMLR